MAAEAARLAGAASAAASATASAAAKGASAASTAAQDRIAANDGAGARLLRIVRMDEDAPIAVEALLVLLVDACHDDEVRDLTDKHVKKAAKRRARRAGMAGALGGPAGIQLASLYCEAEILCDVVDRHRLDLGDEEIAAHLLVLWNAMPDYATAKAAIDGTGQSVAARMAAGVRDTAKARSPKGKTKKEVVRMLWGLRNVADEVQLPGSDSARDVVLPGRRVKALTAAAERQLGVVRV